MKGSFERKSKILFTQRMLHMIDYDSYKHYMVTDNYKQFGLMFFKVFISASHFSHDSIFTNNPRSFTQTNGIR